MRSSRGCASTPASDTSRGCMPDRRPVCRYSLPTPPLLVRPPGSGVAEDSLGPGQDRRRGRRPRSRPGGAPRRSGLRSPMSSDRSARSQPPQLHASRPTYPSGESGQLLSRQKPCGHLGHLSGRLLCPRPNELSTIERGRTGGRARESVRSVCTSFAPRALTDGHRGVGWLRVVLSSQAGSCALTWC